VFATGNLIEAIYPTTLGAVRLTERFGSGDPPDPAKFLGLEEEVATTLKKKTSRPMFAPHFLVGSGGTFTTVAEMVMASKGESDLPVPGYRVSHAEIRHLLDRLRKLPVRARRALPGMTPDRADIIIAGLTIIDGLLKRFRVNTVVVHTRGVRDGLVREMLEDVLGANSAPVDHAALRDAAIERLASACSGEVEHGRAVASLAGRIWEQLAEPLGLDPADRPLLESAARLQDVGYVINYDKHHKHSYHLIRNSRLPGIRAHDLELIANVARYHRGAHPKKKHENLLRLTPTDQARVHGMAAVLRLAGGLDRSRSQQVRDAIVSVEGGSVTLEAVADQDPQVDLWGAERRTDLFEKVFDMPVKFRWAGSGST